MDLSAPQTKFLIHLTGDLHQPLHVGGREDSGGNPVKVQWFGQASNLHRVWDSDMIDGKDLSCTELTEFLGEPTGTQNKNRQAGNGQRLGEGDDDLSPADL